ncbi:MAG: glycosyltransferase family 4 protein [Bacteroidetes bacterium]|nr:glycosyltransferase family 4 protein [Bacteroidota bacterium]
MVQSDTAITTKPELVFTLPDCMGGVSNFNRNIINYASLKKNCRVKAILLRTREDKRQAYRDVIAADEVIRFDYSVFENQYYVCKRLNSLIGTDAGCVITDNSLTLNTVSLCRNPKKIIYLVHDYFYIQNALQYEPVIDTAIAHSSFFKDILCTAEPFKYSAKAYFIPYGVEQQPIEKINKGSGNINLVFLGRWVEEKGVLMLHVIESMLAAKGVQANWTIIGSGPCEVQLKQQWKENNNVVFINPPTTGEVYAILNNQDVLVLPTGFEGTPVSILESISNGVVPVVSDLPGGIRDIVDDSIGYRCQPGVPSEFANAIQELYMDKNKLKQLQKNGLSLAKTKYDILKSADAYFSFFLQQSSIQKEKYFPSPFFSRLDKKFYPAGFVYFIRKSKTT